MRIDEIVWKQFGYMIVGIWGLFGLVIIYLLGIIELPLVFIIFLTGTWELIDVFILFYIHYIFNIELELSETDVLKADIKKLEIDLKSK